MSKTKSCISFVKYESGQYITYWNDEGILSSDSLVKAEQHAVNAAKRYGGKYAPELNKLQKEKDGSL